MSASDSVEPTERGLRRRAPATTERTAQRRSTVEPTFFARFECKYRVDPLLLGQIRHFIAPFTQPDRYAARCQGYRYPVCSLYLDSDHLDLYRQTVAGEKDRFKLRVRTYSDDLTSPAFFEVKRKSNSVVHKRRVGLSREFADHVLNDRVRGWCEALDPSRRRDLDYFVHHVQATRARPVVKVRYLREAYEALGHEPVRITIDTDLAHAVSLGNDLSRRAGRWTATPLDGAVVEIKFTERFPSWVHDLVRAFAMHQQAVPKYVLSIDHMLQHGRSAALSLSGQLLPPLGEE